MKVRRTLAVVLLASALALIIFVLPPMTRNFHNWRHAVQENDRSAAELYQTNFQLDCLGAAVAIGLAALGSFLLWQGKAH